MFSKSYGDFHLLSKVHSIIKQGGETVFPLEGQDGLSRLPRIDYTACDMGYKVKPRAGDGLLFYSIHPNGTFDSHALHGGCPVLSGEKWVITKWLRDKRFGS
jgi:prolyl 4-hydroxylase